MKFESSEVERIIAASSHLSASNFSLFQIANVTRALCSVTVREQIVSTSVNASASPSVDQDGQNQPIVVHFPTEYDKAKYDEIFSSGSDEHKVVAIQYLCQTLTSMQALRSVIYPALTSDSGTVSDELSEALLCMMESSLKGRPFSDQDVVMLQPILDACLQTDHVNTGTILAKLIQIVPTPPVCLLETFYEKLWSMLTVALDETRQESQRSPASNDGSSKTIKNLLRQLTVMTTAGTGNDKKNVNFHRPHITHLWKRLLSAWHDTYASQPRRMEVLIVLTSVFCPLAHIAVSGASKKRGDTSISAAELVVDDPALWEIIFSGLSQGISISEAASSDAALVRKRCLFLLRIVTARREQVWNAYINCFETIELESEQHLVNQVWATVAKLIEKCANKDVTSSSSNVADFSFSWMSLFFGQVLSSERPTLRKLGIYHILNGSSGIQFRPSSTGRKPCDDDQTIQNKQKSAEFALMAIITPDFMLRTFLPSWNSLRSIGYTMQTTDKSSVEKEGMVQMFHSFFKTYVRAVNEGSDKNNFWKLFWSPSTWTNMHVRTMVDIFNVASNSLGVGSSIDADDSMLSSLTDLLSGLLTSTSVVQSHRKELLRSSVNMLANCRPVQTWSPQVIVGTLSIFSDKYFDLDSQDWSIGRDPLFQQLCKWIGNTVTDSTVLAAAVASGFISGDTLPFEQEDWDYSSGSTVREIKTAWAVSLLCSVAVQSALNRDSKPAFQSASELLWPAIRKGLSKSASAMISNGKDAGQVCRALLLLKFGCSLRELSGLGNGTMVLDSEAQHILPIPPQIEAMLQSALNFMLHHLRVLTDKPDVGSTALQGGSTRSSETRNVTVAFMEIISTMRVLSTAYPSSAAVRESCLKVLESSLQGFDDAKMSNASIVQNAVSIYASVSSGVYPEHEQIMTICKAMPKLRLSGRAKSDEEKKWVKLGRTILQFSKWGSLAYLLPAMLSADTESNSENLASFVEEIIDEAIEEVQATPAEALVPLFGCVHSCAKKWINLHETRGAVDESFYHDKMEAIVKALFAIMEDCSDSSDSVFILNEICALIFQPDLMAREHEFIKRSPTNKAPIRDAFRSLISMAGTIKPHIARAALAHTTSAWLGDRADTQSAGLNAIPYRDDIVALLLHKEAKVDECASNQNADKAVQSSSVTKIEATTNEQSIARTFILLFLSQLHNVDEDLNDEVLHELIHYVILSLLEKAKAQPVKQKSKLMKGAPMYCMKIRAWQALCVLSQYVTASIASHVCLQTFQALAEPLYGQVRYFIEVFIIGCGRKFPQLMVAEWIKMMKVYDLPLQQVSSLMIIGGNWIVGRYKLNIFFDDEEGIALRQQSLALIMPWLSSTQGFSRAIAQLLVHELIPCVIENCHDSTSTSSDADTHSDESYVKTIFRFLDENREMKRLRKKQENFFHNYNIDSTCTLEGISKIPLDDMNEVDPTHAIDAIKACLQEVYDEAHDEDKFTPTWTTLSDLVTSSVVKTGNASDDILESSFQRKITPLDSLNLELEDLREKKISNAMNRRKQKLVVCASLVDKIPNLGGLARTAEIFAADRLVIPDLSVIKMDNFKAISVGAGDWMEFEECSEKNLQNWLVAQKEKGYTVVGLEQTSSSVSLLDMHFSDVPTVLLLGKEKEGIPVELLHLVDQCVEIPQLGILRSLNVHVSGAICIWEHTKQSLERAASTANISS